MVPVPAPENRRQSVIMFYQGKRVLVTGSSGLIGTNLVMALVKEGAKVRGVIHQKTPSYQNSAVEYIQADLRERADCARVAEGMEYVFHCASNSSGAVMMKNNPLVHVTGNLVMNAVFLEECWKSKVDRFQFLSTTTVYPPVEHPVKESEAFTDEPFEIYFGVGWMKRYIEKLCEFYYRRFGMKISILRPTNVYGPHDKFDFERSHVLPALIRRAVENQNPFEVWGDGSAVRDFIYVDDMVKVMLLAMEKASDCSAINFGSGTPVTIRQAVDLIIKLTNRTHLEVKYDPTKPTTIPVRRVDLTKCKKVLGYEAAVGFEEGLKKTIEWYVSTLPQKK